MGILPIAGLHHLFLEHSPCFQTLHVPGEEQSWNFCIKLLYNLEMFMLQFRPKIKPPVSSYLSIIFSQLDFKTFARPNTRVTPAILNVCLFTHT